MSFVLNSCWTEQEYNKKHCSWYNQHIQKWIQLIVTTSSEYTGIQTLSLRSTVRSLDDIGSEMGASESEGHDIQQALEISTAGI